MYGDHVIHDIGAHHGGFFSSPGMHAVSVAMHGTLGSHHGTQMSILNMGGLHSFGAGHGHLDPVVTAADARRLQFKNGMPTVDNDHNPLFGYQVHVTYHGTCDFAKNFTNIARQAGLVNINHRANLWPADLQDMQIDDWNRFIPGGAPGTKPSGWYPGATGETIFNRSYWQLGKSPNGNPFRLVEDQLQRTYLVVEMVSWRYHEKGMFETRFTVSIFTPPVWDVKNQRWTYYKEPFELHQSAATFVASRVLALLKSVPGKDLAPSRGNPDPTANPDGLTIEDQAVLIAEWATNLHRVESQDQSRVNDDPTERVTGTIPTPVTTGDDD